MRIPVPDVEIVPVTAVDSAFLRSVAKLSILAWGRLPTVLEVEDRAKRLEAEVRDLDPNQKGIFAARRSGTAVGVGRIVRDQSESSQWMLLGLAVRPDHRRQGIGRALARALIGYARERGATAIRSESHLDNEISIRYHEGIGFKSMGRFTAPDGDEKVAFALRREEPSRNPKDIVREGYDRVSFAYREDHPDVSGDSYRQYKAWIDELSALIDEGASVLDLGCGCGAPAAQLLARRFRVTGADISPVQIERAKRLVPNVSFICGDMCELSFPSRTFDAVVCFYAMIHVPVEEQQTLLGNIWDWMKPGGYFLLSAGHRAWTGEETDWMGVEGATMYWSHADRDTYVRWLEDTGFIVIWDRFIPEGNSGHSLILARKRKHQRSRL